MKNTKLIKDHFFLFIQEATIGDKYIKHIQHKASGIASNQFAFSYLYIV